ncbi:transcription factor bHLH112-like [Aristolochia californica]|uniref:transcription factor bHLH112-like n=1 Tax=Aristolochia californica TaxID=171875 RepID=UPI0035E29C6E
MQQWMGWSSEMISSNSSKQIFRDSASVSSNCKQNFSSGELVVSSSVWEREVTPGSGVGRENRGLSSFSGNLSTPEWMLSPGSLLFPVTGGEQKSSSSLSEAPMPNPSNHLFLHGDNSSFSEFLTVGQICPEDAINDLSDKNLLQEESRVESERNEPETTTKRQRTNSPPSFTTFKVRKEKLGDRISALQQLVSPFGKTDTASVLFDATEYIKILHEQVTVLSRPYMKLSHQYDESDNENHREASEHSLRSKGLCLIPVSTTLHMANENLPDFWAPTFGRSNK